MMYIELTPSVNNIYNKKKNIHLVNYKPTKKWRAEYSRIQTRDFLQTKLAYQAKETK